MPTPAHDMTIYQDALVILATAGIAIPVMHRFRIPPVLGYLAAGVLLGPSGLGALADVLPPLRYVTIGDPAEIGSIAELGVVFLLFIIGLELSTERLLTMRHLVFGLGVLQVLLSSAVIGGIALAFGQPPAAALLIGLCLALSSTAVVLEWLSQRRRLATQMGRVALAVLLLQDLAVIPILFLVDLLGAQAQASLAGGLGNALLQAGAMLAAIVMIGRWVLRPLFRMVARADSPELFMAATLLVAIGTGVLAGVVGLSMAFGGFIAGILLAETEYRKAIEAVIEPFKGLLLGVFFISIGMRIDLVALWQDPGLLAACAAGLIIIKAAVMIPLVRGFGLGWIAAVESGLLLGPGGEFAFIILGIAAAIGVIAPATAGPLLAVVALTMAMIPLLGIAGERLARRLARATAVPPELLETPPDDSDVRAIVVGAGRVGRLVSHLLSAHNVPHILTDRDDRVVIAGRAAGIDIYYGDAKHPAFLRRCGIMNAKALILTLDAPGELDEIVAVAQGLRDGLQIVARARDAEHARRLYARGVTDAVPETIEASLQLSEAALIALGEPMGPVIATIHTERAALRQALQSGEGETR